MITPALTISSFIAGILTFLAPCTLPLVPGYLGFISGVSLDDLKDPTKAAGARKRIIVNGILYVIGFSAVFIVLGTLVGLGGVALIQYRDVLSRIGGIFIIVFGLYMLGVFNIPALSFLNGEKRLPVMAKLTPGTPASSLVFGAAFAFGWTPCVGPILGAILTLAATSATVGQGAFLLTVFSTGLAIPFILVAVGIGSATRYIARLEPIMKWVSVIGGIFLIIMGVLLLTNEFARWIAVFYRLFDFINYERILDWL